MTKTKLTYFALVFLTAGAATAYVSLTLSSKRQYTDQCTASVIVFYKDIQANMTLDFMYNQKKQNGVISISGSYTQNNRSLGTIRRDISYAWTENKDTYNFISTRVNKFENIETLSDDRIAMVLPDFYVYPDKRINYSIQTQGDNGFLFIIGKRPIFYCAR